MSEGQKIPQGVGLAGRENVYCEGHRYIGSLFRVDEPVPVLLVQTVDISNDRQLTLFESIFRRTHVKYYNGMKKMFRQGVSA